MAPELSYDPTEKRLCKTVAEEVLGPEFSPYQVDLLPLLAWPACAVLLLLVFLSHVRGRTGVALVSLLVAALAVTGTCYQVSWYGLADILEPFDPVERLVADPASQYGITAMLCILAALLSLTSNARLRELPAQDQRQTA